MNSIETDLCIIGAGSGGLSLAAGAAQMGARVVLLEGGQMGGDCLNTGCVPSKALIAAAKAAQTVRNAAKFGIAASEPEIDFAAVKDYVAKVIADIAPNDSQERFEGLGVQVIREWGKFISPTEVAAGETVIKARRFVIATGSHAAIPPIDGIESVPYLTNETIFGQRDRPEHLLVLGGGPIGMEMAQAHRRLGCKVTVIEGFKAFGRDDPETSAIVMAALRTEGVTILEGNGVVRLRKTESGIEMVLADGSRINGSHLLVAAGRQVAVDKLNLAVAGVTHSKKGISVGADLRTSNRRIYAIGDVAGGLQFTHVASAHSGIVIRQALLGLPAKFSTKSIPWVTYCEPELAQVGLTEAEARKTYGAAVTVLRTDFAHNDRAHAEGKAKGLIKVMVVKGRPVGASIAGPQAGELISLWALAISSGQKISAIATMTAPYPTLGEISKRTAGAYFSPKLFDNPLLKGFVKFVQRSLP